MKFEKLSIVIPAYNEGKTIHLILDKIKQVELLNGISKEIIIVNDCSTDNTSEAIQSYMKQNEALNIRLHNQEYNQGKGAALHQGIKLATGDYVIIQDADLEYDPQEYNLLIKPVLDGFADIVYGSRFLGGNAHRILFFWHTIGNKFLTFLSNMFTNLNLSDMETCYKMFRRDIIQSLELKEKRFGFEPEVTAKIARVKDVRIYEVGISYYGRTFAEGKKIGWKDGFRAIYCIIKYNFRHFRIFKHFSSFIIALCLLIGTMYAYKNRVVGWDKEQYKTIITADGRGYYLYLPAIFIYNDLQYSFIEPIEKSLGYSHYAADYLINLDKKKINLYPLGLAILWFPFFLIAYFLSFLLGFPLDGYSFLFQVSIVGAALFYVGLGLIFLKKLIRSFIQSEIITGFAVGFIFLATNLFYYTTIECSMTHAYSFSLISIWSYLLYSLSKTFSSKKMLLSALLLGLIFTIRPSNVFICAFIPFLAGTPQLFRNLIIKVFFSVGNLLRAILFVLLVPILQMIFWKIQSGSFFIDTYSLLNLSLDFSKPHIGQILVSYRKGLFVYTPILFISLLGFIKLFRSKNWFSFISLLVALSIIIYVVSSWPIWWYGGSYGMRPMIDIYVFFGLLLAFAFSWKSKVFKALLIGMCSVLMVVNFIQMYQYRSYIMHWIDMNKASYWKIFLKTDDSYKGILYNKKNTLEVGDRKEFARWKNSFDAENVWGNSHTLSSVYSSSAPNSVLLSTINTYSPTLIIPRSDLGDSTVVLQVSCKVMVKSNQHLSSIVVSTEDGTSSLYYDAFALNSIAPSNSWNDVSAKFFVPRKELENEFVKIYFYCTEGELYVDDVEVIGYR